MKEEDNKVKLNNTKEPFMTDSLVEAFKNTRSTRMSLDSLVNRQVEFYKNKQKSFKL